MVDMTDPIRVLLLTHNYPRYQGDSSGVFLSLLARSLVPHGIEPTVLTPHDAGVPESDLDGSIKIRRFRYADDTQETLAYRGNMHQLVLGSLNGPWRFRRFLATFEQATERVIADEQIDLIWGHWLVPAGIVLKRLSKHHQLPLLLSSHGSDIRLVSKYRFFAWPYFKPLVPELSGWTVVSSFLREQLTALDARLESMISVLPLPHDEHLFYRDPLIQRDPNLVVAVTRFTDQKRVNKLISAFKLVCDGHPPARLDIYGAGPLKSDISAQIETLGLTKSVRIMSPVTQSELAAVYNKAGIAVLNSVNEGFGLALSEAMLCGAAVIGVKSGGITDIITNGETGLLAPPDDPEQLAACLLQMLREQTLRERLAVAGHTAATERYASGPLAGRYADLIRRTSAEGKSSH